VTIAGKFVKGCPANGQGTLLEKFAGAGYQQVRLEVVGGGGQGRGGAGEGGTLEMVGGVCVCVCGGVRVGGRLGWRDRLAAGNEGQWEGGGIPKWINA
jgi:hypothetical protein